MQMILISILGVPAQGLVEVVRFVYTGKLRCTLGNITDVLLAATHLQVTEAIELCSHFLTSMTSTTNSVHMYNLADQFNLPHLCSKALKLILENLQDVADRGDYVHFSEKFLAQILEDNRLQNVSELKLFELALSWINYKPNDRVKFAFFLMSRIRLPLIPPHDLIDHVMSEPLMIKGDPQCLDLVLEANKYHMLPDRQPNMQNLRTQVRAEAPSLVLMDIDDEGPRVLDLTTLRWGRLNIPRIEAYHAQVCTLQNYMYVCGGIDLFSSNNPISVKCLRVDPRFNSICEVQPMEHFRHHFMLCSDGRSLFAIGGNCQGVYKSVVEQFVVKLRRWVTRRSMDHSVSAGAAVVLDNRIFVSGGQNERGIIRSMCRYNIKTDQWQDCPPMQHARMDHFMCCSKQKLYVIGGYDKNIARAFDVATIEVFDVETSQWTSLSDPAPKLSGVESCQVGKCVYVAGGFSYDENRKRSEVWCYDVDTGEWTIIARLFAPNMSLPCCALFLPHHAVLDIDPNA